MLRTGSYSFLFKEKGLPRLCLAMTLGCKEDVDFTVVKKIARFPHPYVPGPSSLESLQPSNTHTHLTTHFDSSLKALFLTDNMLV